MSALAAVTQTIEWTALDEEAARIQGWCVSKTHGAAETYQLQKLDHMDIFQGDEEVWRHVARRAEWGDTLCASAMSFLQAYSPDEYETVCEYDRITA